MQCGQVAQSPSPWQRQHHSSQFQVGECMCIDSNVHPKVGRCKLIDCRLRIVGEEGKVVGPEQTGELQVVASHQSINQSLTVELTDQMSPNETTEWVGEVEADVVCKLGNN